jgi:hypothetical protein
MNRFWQKKKLEKEKSELVELFVSSFVVFNMFANYSACACCTTKFFVIIFHFKINSYFKEIDFTASCF